jgi:small-conductance mechanosensitive channel
MPTRAAIVQWFAQPLAGNPMWLWAAAALVGALTLLALLLARRILSSRLRARAATSGGRFVTVGAEVVSRTHIVFLFAVAVLAGSAALALGERAVVLRSVLVVVTLLQAGAWGAAFVTGATKSWRERHAQDPSSSSAAVAISFLARLVIWAVVLLVALDNLGVHVTSLIAGLGIGGVAVALAVQNILGDLFASVSIMLDKPFEIGDFVVVGDLMGTVEHIGLKTTRVRSLSGEQIVFSNGDLLASRIRNFKRMNERRIVFTLGVVYQTPPDKLAAIPAMVRAIVQAQPDVRFDRAHFARFGDFALVFEVVYFMTKPDYTLYMDAQHAINLAILRAFAEERIEFAYPTQSLFVQQAAPARTP